ncbi:amidohydrolase family protein [Dactylosporangium sp. NPDC005572]|uniref:amidohydrolase family protein n=1 Tax=Dactylosporangium sp. NPDC005572 TaxID=3156889 RepID=UPI0033A48A49
MRTLIANVRVFDGHGLRPPGSVVVDGDRFGSGTEGDRVIDGAGATALPGLIDAHLHLDGRESLDRLVRAGVTTALDMGNGPMDKFDALRYTRGLTDVRTAGVTATAPGGMHANIPFLRDHLIQGAHEAEAFVAARLAEGSDYVKIIVGNPEPSHDQATLDAITAAAHRHRKLVVAHAISTEAYRMALQAGVDVLTHVPLDRPLDDDTAARIAAEGRAMVPTLGMMAGVVAAGPGFPARYEAAEESVAVAHRAGVPIIAGTDANTTPGVWANPPFGEALHRELELLAAAGLSPAEALRAATSRPAERFGLTDRGAIRPGLRADLVLVDGDPLADLGSTRAVTRVWCGGVEHTPAELARAGG